MGNPVASYYFTVHNCKSLKNIFGRYRFELFCFPMRILKENNEIRNADFTSIIRIF